MISRLSVKNRKTITLTDSLATTPEIDMREMAGGFIRVVGAPVTLTFYGATDVTSADHTPTFVPLHKIADNSALGALTVTQAKGYAFPDECFGCRAVKIVAGTTAQEIEYSLKG